MSRCLDLLHRIIENYRHMYDCIHVDIIKCDRYRDLVVYVYIYIYVHNVSIYIYTGIYMDNVTLYIYIVTQIMLHYIYGHGYAILSGWLSNW